MRTKGTARPPPPVASAQSRFRALDAYRAGREWSRYEGTAQRDLFRRLRERFLDRHAVPTRWVLDLGSGPGRFTARLGTGPEVRRVAADLSREMLAELGERWPRDRDAPSVPARVRADALEPPFLAAAFDAVAALGNLVGFAEDESERALDALTGLVAPGGRLLLEVAPGSGERSRYLHRLPASAVARLFRSAPSLIAGRIAREGFDREPRRKTTPGRFARIDVPALRARLGARGFEVLETVAVAPALGADPNRLAAVHRDEKSWSNLLAVEEALGRSADRWPDAAAVLVAATRRGTGGSPPKSEG